MSDSLLITLITFAYLTIVLLIGIQARKGQESTLESYVTGGRHMGFLILFFIFGAEIFSAFAFLGAPGWSYSKGAPAFYIMAYLSGSVIIWWLLAPGIANAGRKKGFLTQAEFLCNYFPGPGLGLFIGIVSIVAMIPYLTIQITGAGLLFEVATDGVIPFWLGSLLACGVVAAYVFTSGLKGIGWTNLVQGIMMVMVAWYIGLASTEHLYGGVSEMFQQLKAEAPEYLTMPGAKGMGWGAFSTAILVSMFGLIMWPHVFMKFYSANSVKTLKRVFVVYPLYGLLLVPLLIIGFSGILLFKDAPLASEDRVLLEIVVNLANFPAWLIGIALSGALAAAMSTAANLAHSSATVLVQDVINRLPIFKSVAESKALLMMKISVIIIIFLSYALALAKPASLVALLLGGYGVIVQLFPMLLSALYWPIGNTKGAIAGLLVGSILTLYFQIYGGAPFDWHGGFIGLIVNLVVFISVSLLTNKNTLNELSKKSVNARQANE